MICRRWRSRVEHSAVMLVGEVASLTGELKSQLSHSDARSVS